MSSQNSFQRPAGGRPAANPADQDRLRQPSWVNPQAQSGYPAQPTDAWPPQQGNAPQGGGFSQQAGYGQQRAPQQPDFGQSDYGNSDYGQWGALQTGQPNHPVQSQTDPYAPQFEPYVAPGNSHGRPQASGYGQQQPNSPQWPGRGAAADQRGFEQDRYGGPGYNSPGQQPGHGSPFGDSYQEPELSAADWAGQPSEFGHDGYQQQARGGADLGFATAEGGELDPVYAEDEGDYEDEETPRSRRPIMIVMALAGAILVGGGMAYGYKKMTSGGTQGEPPVIKSEAFPSKTKPADAGGKTFPYSDTKIMGRLGDGTSTASAEGSENGEAAPESAPAATESAPPSDDAAGTNEGGPRKVSTLVVGRDGSIQAPPEPAPTQVTGVPGTALVDVFGQSGGGHGRDEPLPQANAGKPVTGDDAPAPVKKAAVTPVKINGAKPSAATGSISERDDAATPAPTKRLKKVARAETSTTSDAYSASGPPITAASAGSGYVAVIASVPHSESSRIDALKRYADMQQKYATALAGKTPDISTANLGAKGNFDRLVVGPPGSRQEANNVCSQLKAEGYTSCWVTTY